jgi:uncharacterized protein (DUF1499 family)
MRRLTLELTPSRAALWSRRLALFALAVVLFGVLLGRFGRIEPQAALAVLGAGLSLALVAVACALAAFAIIWRDGRPGAGAAVGGFLLALLLLAFPTYLAAQALRLPLLNDVATDRIDPPQFSRSRRALEMRGGRTLPEPAADTRVLQQAAYPAITPIVLEIEPERALPLVLAAARNQGWQVYESVAPGGRGATGHVEAIARTPIMGFVDDITVRLRPQAAGTRIDVRSASRLGSHDLGANAKRIQAFVEELFALAEAVPATPDQLR